MKRENNPVRLPFESCAHPLSHSTLLPTEKTETLGACIKITKCPPTYTPPEDKNSSLILT